MLYRKMPKNGEALSILGFGCMRLPVKENGAIDEERAQKQVRYAIDRGGELLDTAWPYHMGQSEPFLGRALAEGYRDGSTWPRSSPPRSSKAERRWTNSSLSS